MKTSSSVKIAPNLRLAALMAVGLISFASGPLGFAQSSTSAASETIGREFLISSLDRRNPPDSGRKDAAEAGVSSSLPDFPDAPNAAAEGGGQATNRPSKRVLGIIPNYRSVGVGAQLPPQTVRNKFSTAFSDTVDPASFVLAGIVAGYDDARNATPEFHHGAVAYGRYYWHSLADQSIENVMVEFIVPSLAHEDTRYYTLGTGSTGRRLEYSLTRPFVTRSDSGKKTVNLGELLGAGMSAGISSRYYPPSQRDAGSVLESYALSLGIDAASFVLREFDNDISRMFSRKH